MSQEESGFDGSIYFRLLAAVAAADGEIRPAEVEKFRGLLSASGASPDLAELLCAEAMENRSQPLGFLEEAGEVPPEMAGLYLRDAFVIACADGQASDAENHLIREAAKRLRVESSFGPIREWTLKWLEVLRESARLFPRGSASEKVSE